MGEISIISFNCKRMYFILNIDVNVYLSSYNIYYLEKVSLQILLERNHRLHLTEFYKEELQISTSVNMETGKKLYH